MNKYQEALDEIGMAEVIITEFGDSIDLKDDPSTKKEFKLLQKLVDKENPVSVINQKDSVGDTCFDCPKCKTKRIIWSGYKLKYCPICGQRIEVHDD